MSTATFPAQYNIIKAEILSLFRTYTTVFPVLSKAGLWADCLEQAVALGDFTSALQNFIPAFLADSGFHNTVFQAQVRNDTTFAMPPCYGVVRTLTRRIHETRAATQPATVVATAINTATTVNSTGVAAVAIPAPAPATLASLSSTVTAGNGNSAGVQVPVAAMGMTPVSTVTAPLSVRPRGTRRPGRKIRSAKSAPVVIDSDDGEDDVQIVGGDIAMGEITHPPASPITTDVPMSVDSEVPGAVLNVEPSAGTTPTVSTVGLPADLKFKKAAASEPVIESTDSTKAQAVHFAKKGFEGSRKRQRASESGLSYINKPDRTKLAFATSSTHLNAAASSVAGPSSMDIMDRASHLVDQVTPAAFTEASLVKQEADLRAELQVTTSRISYLLQFFDLVKAQHVKVLQALHVAEGPSN
ncbi:hypothetical protein DFH05DRAFT_1527195 [Lentinula detonsa]|uniref:Uncharacterized protein n=1 Tax=Lentinula detonsa TaxID=2804962 RepID=A0A9W8TW81_9AGAR|nr:hypothetical protein DFH05DRAFT_1527195 [Lentinula detonsa]